jgi:glucose/arabinose dehydrogenase
MAGTIFLRDTELRVEEDAGTLGVQILRAGSLDGAVTITYGIGGDSATAGQDFVSGTFTVTMAAGVASLTVPVTILDDALGEATEVLSFRLISVANATLQAPRTTRISILDDETPAPPPPEEPPLVPSHDVTFEPIATGLAQPVRFVLSPTDPTKVWIAEKPGIVSLLDLDTGERSVALDIRDKVNDTNDRGLLGIEIHPDFANNPYVYLFYVVDPPETAFESGNAGRDGGGNRFSYLVRYTADEATGFTTLLPDSEVILLGAAGQSLDDINGGGAVNFTNPGEAGNAPSSERYVNPDDPTPPEIVGGIKQDYLKADSLSHAGGSLAFGPDGALYVGIGDGTSYNYADPRSADVQALNSLSGKILRIDPITGQGLADNPFVTGGVDLDSNRAKVFQLGLRNPFSLATDAEGRLIITDTGWYTWEEINLGPPGANFGWPWFEGADGGLLETTPEYRDLPGAATFYDAVADGRIQLTAPFRAFSHAEFDPGYPVQAITGGSVVYTGDRYPAEFANDFFFADFSNGRLFSVDVDDRQAVKFLLQIERSPPIHMAQGADGWIYYADIWTGEFGRLRIEDIVPPGASPEQGLVAGGAAAAAGGGAFLVTPADPYVAGIVASTTRVDLRQDARFVFELWLGSDDAGADGMTFLLHNDPRGAAALGEPGEGLGAGGIARAAGIEFDTWQNGGDALANDHAGFFGFGAAAAPVDLGNIEDGTWHRVEVTWNAATQTLAFSFDGVAMDSVSADIAAAVLASPFAHFAVTGATGGAFNAQQVRFLQADVTYEDVPGNQAPVLFGGAARSLAVPENTAGAFLLPVATDAEGDALAWRILTGGDGALFRIDRATGALSFQAPPDFEAPLDADGDNTYALTIAVTDPSGARARQELTVTVADMAAEGGVVLRGTNGPDLLRITPGTQIVQGLNGDDTILAAAGDGSQLIRGDNGTRDTYSLAQTSAAATVSLASGVATSSATGSDTLEGIENVTGGGGGDSITGNSRANTLSGGGGADTLTGGSGNDLLIGGAGADWLDGARGADRIRYYSAAQGGDTLVRYRGLDDVTEVSASGFGGGLVAGMNLVATGRYAENLTGLSDAAAGTGQFIYERDARTLWWDADGAGGTGAVEIATLVGGRDWSGAEIVVIA